MKKIYWLSRHDLSPAQVSAIRSLHGEDAEIVKNPVVFNSADALADYIRNHADGFIYAVASPPHYITAALAGLRFGVFENHPKKREDGNFGLAAVYHVNMGSLKKVWVNPDPMNDEGEALVPIIRHDVCNYCGADNGAINPATEKGESRLGFNCFVCGGN